MRSNAFHLHISECLTTQAKHYARCLILAQGNQRKTVSALVTLINLDSLQQKGIMIFNRTFKGMKWSLWLQKIMEARLSNKETVQLKKNCSSFGNKAKRASRIYFHITFGALVSRPFHRSVNYIGKCTFVCLYLLVIKGYILCEVLC